MCLCFCDFTTSIRRKPNVVTFSFVHNCQSHDVLPFYEIKLRNLALIVFWVSFAPMVQNHRKIIPLRQTFRPFIEPQQRQSALIHTPKIYQAKKNNLPPSCPTRHLFHLSSLSCILPHSLGVFGHKHEFDPILQGKFSNRNFRLDKIQQDAQLLENWSH